MKMTSLVKRHDVPHTIITDPNEVAMGAAEISRFRGKTLSVLLHDDATDIELIACQRPYDLPYYVAVSGVLTSNTSKDGLSLLRVKVMDPTNLPYEMVFDEEAFVIYDEWDYCQFFNIKDVVNAVEQTIRIYRNTDVEQDFVVLIGYEMGNDILDLLLERVNKWKEHIKIVHNKTNHFP